MRYNMQASSGLVSALGVQHCDPNEPCQRRDCHKVAGKTYCTPWYNDPACITRVQSCRGLIAQCIVAYLGTAAGGAACYTCLVGTAGAGLYACLPLCGVSAEALQYAINNCTPN
jgi:hypothetical protein